MKTEAVYKRAYNDVLELVVDRPRGAELPSESELSTHVGVSRTTVRKVIRQLEADGIIATQGNARRVLRKPRARDAFPESETVSAQQQVERRVMEWMLRGDRTEGTAIRSLELAREFNVSTTGIREFLNRFSRFGLIEKRPNSNWMFKGFNRQFALELFEIREMFELRSAQAFASLPADAPQWARLSKLREEHIDLLEMLDTHFRDFSRLDDRFHRLVHEASHNRFIDDFYDVIALVFHYHYQWNKLNEKQRNHAAIDEHLVYMDALLSRDVRRVEKACRAHLLSAKTTLLASLRTPGDP